MNSEQVQREVAHYGHELLEHVCTRYIIHKHVVKDVVVCKSQIIHDIGVF